MKVTGRVHVNEEAPEEEDTEKHGEDFPVEDFAVLADETVGGKCDSPCCENNDACNGLKDCPLASAPHFDRIRVKAFLLLGVRSRVFVQDKNDSGKREEQLGEQCQYKRHITHFAQSPEHDQGKHDKGLDNGKHVEGAFSIHRFHYIVFYQG